LGSVDANFGLNNVNAAVEVNYDLSGTSFVFPPQGGSNTNGIASSSKREFYFYFLFLVITMPCPTQINPTNLNTLNHRGDIQRRPERWRDAHCVGPSHPAS